MGNLRRHIYKLSLFLLLAAGMNNAWAATVTYHILTLPINSSSEIKAAYYGKRMEAVKVKADDATQVVLPKHFKSPLAKNFKYYAADDVERLANPELIYDNGNTKYYLYNIKGETTPDVATDDATPIAENTAVTNDCDIYVTYEYDADNTIAKLDGSVKYNIVFNNGFLALNRGRNNRLCVMPKDRVTAEQLCSEDFVYINVDGTGISPYWSHGDNKNSQAVIGSKFHFLFTYKGEDPYNVRICTGYDRDSSYVEKNNDNGKFVNKYYKGSELFAQKDAATFFSSDVHVRYTTVYTTSTDVTSESRPGYYHASGAPVWNSVALLNNDDNNGFVYLGTRLMTDANSGNIVEPELDSKTKKYKYYYLKSVSVKDINFQKVLVGANETPYTTDGKMYRIMDVDFNVTTPFSNNVSASRKLSEYTMDHEDIDAKFIPDALRRKYCDFTYFYKDAAYSQQITKFTQATGNHIYVGYEVHPSIPFKTIAPSAPYSDATWYELTDSAETNDMKITWDAAASRFRNNSPNTVSDKLSEFAFIGDPYEMQVIHRQQTETGGAKSYVGGATTLGISAADGADYHWDIPDDDVEGSMLLRKYGGTAQWYWDVAAADQDVECSTENATRIKVKALPPRKITYKVIDKTGRIAVTASANQTIFSPLSVSSIPSIIASPFLRGETVSFYGSYDSGGGPETGTNRADLSMPVTETPSVDDTIYVSYTTTDLATKPVKLSENQEFNVRLNGEYIYCETTAGETVIKSTPTPAANDLKSDAFLWKLRCRDPYCMIIDNLGARVDHGVADQTEDVTIYGDDGTSRLETRQKGAWVADPTMLADPASITNGMQLRFSTDRSKALRFIAKAGLREGVYEVMLATGNGIDASETYYNIGRTTSDVVSFCENTDYVHGSPIIAFMLEQSTDYMYHLIDKGHKELLTAESKNPELVLPAEYQSPLVGTYHFYILDDFNVNGTDYNLKPSATELSTIYDLDAEYTITEGNYAADWSSAGARALTAIESDKMNEMAKRLSDEGDYYCLVGGTTYYHINVTKPFYKDIYVTYEKNNLVKFNDSGSPYLLRFLDPFVEGYYLEDGADKLTGSKIQAVYPYCNGDGSINIYGMSMKEEQMEAGANTRPRWIWFFQSSNDDPYHVSIRSKSTISYNNVSHYTYLQTYAVHFNQDTDNPNKQRVITGGMLPGIASTAPTEYMILGTAGRYKLLTSKAVPVDLDGDENTNGPGENERQYVTTLEQYWKTYNMLKLHVLGIPDSTNAFSDDAATFVVPTEDDPKTTADESTYRPTIEARDWHSYNAVANATRWNGYNNVSSGKGKKVVENIEHWFQTFNMGNGTFDIESADIPPVLVLLDRHGWEIMRKPLPTHTYPYGEELDELRKYDSPMVDKYYFYNNATKASGCHKFTLRVQNGALRDEIKVSGKPYSSSSLTALPPLTATGVKDGNGVFQDMYVTYTVKDEYESSYEYHLEVDEANQTFTESGTPMRFLVLQNGRFLRDNQGETNDKDYNSKPISEASDPTGGNVYDMIFHPNKVKAAGVSTNVDANDDGYIDDINLWYVEPNLDIDKEMGIHWATVSGNTGEPKMEYEMKKDYKDKTGFDPYNLQFRNAQNGKYITSHIKTTAVNSGAMKGDYSGGGSDSITLEAKYTGYDPDVYRDSEGYDHTNLQMSNQTFMAVMDANGNMQLMPRFDHSVRVNTIKAEPRVTTLEAPVDHAKASTEDNASMGPQTTFLVPPQIFSYHIIDNDGREALRYKRAGEFYPSVPEPVKSPLAKDFTYFKTFTDGVVSDTIKGSFGGSGLKAVDKDNEVYVRYSYDESYDVEQNRVLQGRWLTMTINGKDVKASGTINPNDGTGVTLLEDTKPAVIDSSVKEWQWKFISAPTDTASAYYRPVDPYGVQIFNRMANYSSGLEEPNPMGVGIKVNGEDRFAILSHPNGGYALAVAGTESYEYSFLNAADMTSAVPATTAVEPGFNINTGVLTDATRIYLYDDVTHNYIYHVITNANKWAASTSQNENEAELNHFAPTLPEDLRTPLLNMDAFSYYGSVNKDNKGTVDTSDDTYEVVNDTKLTTLYGLYDDTLYVRYNDYDIVNCSYRVPNKRNATGGTVARDPDSRDVAFDISGILPYNIIWESDNMMKAVDNNPSDDVAYDGIGNDADHLLSGQPEHMWLFEGSDPYALKIKHRASGKYAVGTGALSATADNTFMMLKKENYPYGILQMTGTDDKLTGYGQTTTTGDPTKYIIFGLSTHKLIYHLVINTTNAITKIPYRSGGQSTYQLSGVWKESDVKDISGSTQRDLTSVNTGEGPHYPGEKYQMGETINGQTYCYDAGEVSIGDALKLPEVFYRPNVSYDFYIGGIWNEFDDETKTAKVPNTVLDNKYKGLMLPNLMSDADLIGKTVLINVVYSFNKELATNNGLDFVHSTDENMWYTFETNNAGTPMLARHNVNSRLQAMSGRESHYTNDYLWTPVGDPYGFKMYNRYALKNNHEAGYVMTATVIDEGPNVMIGEPGVTDNPDAEGKLSVGYDIFELLPGDVDGYFHVHPMVNNEGTQYFVKRDETTNLAVLSTTPSDWTFGLDLALMQPYYDRAGYVGGLTPEGKVAYEQAEQAERVIMALQSVVYSDRNIIPFEPGYYRMHSQPGIAGISPVRYASGYLHKTELTSSIPMHFYSKAGVATTFGENGLEEGYTVSAATRGDIPIPEMEQDPSAIFYIAPSSETGKYTLSTQGLYMAGSNADGSGSAKTRKAIMVEGEANATPLELMDIGGAVLLIHGGGSPFTRQYLNFDQVADLNSDGEPDKYDLKFYHNVPTDDIKWCLKPVKDDDGLVVATNDGGDGHYYTTFYAPFDVLLPEDNGNTTYGAYVCAAWQKEGLATRQVPASGTYAAGKFVPAGSAVIIRTSDNTGTVTLSLPTSEPSATPLSCAFTGAYLEQLLSLDAANDVYTLGLPFTSHVEKDADYATTGDITAPVPEQAETGVGFYINATPNKEASDMQSLWFRNNRYVLHNKIYYRGTGDSGTEAKRYVPLLFAFDQSIEEIEPEESTAEEASDLKPELTGVYDMMGRKVVAAEEMNDNQWRQRLSPGLYIVNGRKVSLK